MDKNNFSKDIFFDTSEFPFPDIFSEDSSVWEAIPKIGEFIRGLFEKGMVKENYKEKYVFIGKGTRVEEGVCIQGPCIIGKNSVIGHGAFLRENCLIGDTVHIGHGVEIKNSIFLNNAHAAHLNYIGDSIIGNSVNIAAGAMFANFRLDQKPVLIKSGETTIETNLIKLGSVVGDHSSIGANAVLNPGTILGKNVVVYPLTSVKGVHAKDSVIR